MAKYNQVKARNLAVEGVNFQVCLTVKENFFKKYYAISIVKCNLEVEAI